MKREILFRGKRVDNGEWVEGNYCLRLDQGIYVQGIYVKEHCIQVVTRDESGKVIKVSTYEVYPSTVGQYTGLQDKNGVKIFEGDYTDSDSYGRLEVKWNRMKCEFYAENVYDKELYFISSDDEVTGNIHETQSA